MDSQIRIEDLKYKKFREEIADMPEEKLIHEFYQKTLLCDENEQIMENLMDGIFISDGNGHALHANAAYAKLSGIDREEWMGKALQDFIDEGIISNSVVLRVLQERHSITEESYFLKTDKRCLITCNPIFSKDGTISLTVSNLRDLTEIYKLRDAMKNKEEKASRYLEELEIVKKQLKSQTKIIAEDMNMILVLRTVERIAPMESTVMISGESGTGKEVIAQHIHECSKRKGNFIRINCGAIAESLFESELFGYESGSFTGAKKEGKMGLIEAADKGTLFLDEIGEMPMSMQTKLLRVIQEREVTRVGGIEAKKVNVRIVAATNRDLLQMVGEKKFREDLYYRLNVVPIHIPPLRERKNDILPLAQHFLDGLNEKYSFEKRLSEEAIQSMLNYSWPGNVRELCNIVERSVLMSENNVISYLAFTCSGTNRQGEDTDTGECFDLKERLNRIEFDYMNQAYLKYKNVRDAAKSLKMSKSCFANRYQQFKENFEMHNEHTVLKTGQCP